MKTEILAFFGIICVASVIEEAGSCSEEPVKSFIEVLKAVNETMVYYLKPKPDTALNKSYCNAVTNYERAHFGITMTYPASTVIEQQDGYYKISYDGNVLDLLLCAGEIIPVYLNQDYYIKLPNNKHEWFSKSYHSVDNITTAFWISTPEVLASGKVDILTVTYKPLLKLIAFKDTKGTYILQLLKKIKFTQNQKIWLTNSDELIVRQVSSTSDMKNFSQLGLYLKYSVLPSFMKEDPNYWPLPAVFKTDEMIFLILILIVSLVTWYFVERLFGMIINCIILSRARRRGCGAMWCNVFSQNMINFHLHMCQFEKKSFIRHSIRAPFNLYDEVSVNK